MANLKLEQTYYIRAPVETVYDAVTKPTKWMLEKAKFTNKKGAEYVFQWIGGYKEKGKVLDTIKNKRLVLAWNMNTKVAFTFRKSGKYTVLHVVHSGFAKGPSGIQMWGGTKSGWAYYLMNLKSVVENKKDLRHEEDNVF